MSCETFTTSIEDSDYAYTQLPARKSLKLKYDLLGMMGGALSELAKAFENFDEEIESVQDDFRDAIKNQDDLDEKRIEKRVEQIKAFGNVIERIFAGNSSDDMVDFIERALLPAFKNGKRIDIDRDFTGKLKQLYAVLFWVLQCEYGDFLEGLEDL